MSRKIIDRLKLLEILVGVLFVGVILLSIGLFSVSAYTVSLAGWNDVQDVSIEAWNTQVELNEINTEWNQLQDTRLGYLEEGRIVQLDVLSGIQDNILFIFEVIDDYIFVD